jgi:hypothetical protein
VRNLEHVRFVWWRLALAGLVVQLVLFAGPVAAQVGPEGPAIYVASTLAVLVALLRNLSLPGLAVIAVGGALNLIAIIANGGAMPSAPEAWLALTGTAGLPVSHFSNSVLIGPDTLFPFLGDVFVWPRPLPLANIFSIGDAVIAVGAVVFPSPPCAARAPQAPDKAAPEESPLASPPRCRACPTRIAAVEVRNHVDGSAIELRQPSAAGAAAADRAARPTVDRATASWSSSPVNNGARHGCRVDGRDLAGA